MQHLEGVVHRDLAARNVLVSEEKLEYADLLIAHCKQ